MITRLQSKTHSALGTAGPRVAVASSGLGHVSRGIESWASDLGQALADRGASVILCKGGGSSEADYERIIPCWTRESGAARQVLSRMPRFLGWRLGLGNGYGIEQTTFTWNLLTVLRRERIDILHVQDPQVAVLVQRARAVGLVKARTILAHGTEESDDFLRRIAYLQHLAPWHLEEARRQGAWRPTWTAIPNFVDTRLFQPGPGHALREELKIPANATLVLISAAIKRHHKRIDYLVREFALLRARRPDLPLWLVVAGGWENETDALIEEAKQLLGDSVRFLVRFPRARMPDLYRAADLFVLASLKEMMPIALLEALASGRPCIVHEHPVMQWMVGPGGLSGDLSVAGGMAEAIERLSIDVDERAQLGLLARDHCLEHFGREAVVSQIMDYYQRVAHSESLTKAN
jgi:1,2-diacylglycerol 3-alpha-glucosyltransferase